MFNQRTGVGVGALAVSLCLLTSLRADQPPAKPATAIEKGQHVLIVGNSFQNFVDHHLAVTATTAGIKGHIRGGDPLAAVKVDVVASNPWFRIHDKSDKGLDDLVEKALKHNPDIRVLAQVGWLPYDDPVFPMPEKGREKTNWNARTIKDVRAIHESYIKNAEDQVQALNKRLGKQVVFIVPVAQAVIALREKVAAGAVPGLKTQDDLFADSIGHAKPPVELLNAYCHFAVVYRRTPVGLTQKGVKDEKLHRLLQEIAWEAVIKEPLSGVKPEKAVPTPEECKKALLEMMRSKAGQELKFFEKDLVDQMEKVADEKKPDEYHWTGAYRFNPGKTTYVLFVSLFDRRPPLRPHPKGYLLHVRVDEGSFEMKEGRWVATIPRYKHTLLD